MSIVVLAKSIDWNARIRALWAFLDDVRSAGFSLDPRDVLDNLGALWDLVNAVRDLATEAPPGDPAAVRVAAARWADLRRAVDGVSDELTTQRSGIRDSWTGTAADACREALRTLGSSLDDTAERADTARAALEIYADALDTARARHAEVGENLRSAGGRIGLCAPWDVPAMVRGLVDDVVAAARAAIDAYAGATEAARVCAHDLDIVSDQMPFPVGVVGMTAVEVINRPGIPGRETRPLVGDTARRAQEAYDALPPDERSAVDALLAAAPTTEHRAWILATLASGADAGTLARFAGRIAGMTQEDLSGALDPTAVGGLRASNGLPVLQQKTDTTCGSASLVVARMLADPVYALSMLDGYDARTGTADPAGATSDAIAARFGQEESAVHTRTNSFVDRSADTIRPPLVGTKMPWPKMLGTPPWGASEEMNNQAGVPGTSYHVSMIDSDSTADAQRAYDEVARAVDSGRPVPLYTGNDTSPRHVVLVVGRTQLGDLEIFNPANGSVRTVSESGFVDGGSALDAAGSWSRAWAAVTP